MGSDPPECTREECASFFTDIFRALDPPEGAPSWLPQQCQPLPLQSLNITPSMVLNALRKKGSKQSAPGLDGIAYSDVLPPPMPYMDTADPYAAVQQKHSPTNLSRILALRRYNSPPQRRGERSVQLQTNHAHSHDIQTVSLNRRCLVGESPHC